MPVKLEHKLEREAEAKGYRGKRKDRYVYGTLNNLGLLHNHAGHLGPEHLLKEIDMDYKPTIDRVHGIHIGVFTALVVVAIFYFFGKLHMGGLTGNDLSRSAQESPYFDLNSYAGWSDVQYNSLGASAGAGHGEAN